MSQSRFHLSVLFAATSLLSGCAAIQQPVAPITIASLSGSFHGGQQPLSGATVQLYAVGTSGDGSPATPLLSPAPRTDRNGAFVFGSYTCPSPAALVYVVGIGGDPGIGTQNHAATLMTALGPCGNLTPSTYISVNEVSTVASIFPLAAFANSYGQIGSGTSDQQNLAGAFAEVSNILDTSSGKPVQANVQSSLAVSLTELNTLADVISSCVNSPGGTAGDNSNCGKLFTSATPAGAPAPTNTLDALINIATHPDQNVASIFLASPPVGPYQPTLSSPPSSWSLHQVPVLPARSTLLAQYLLNEGSGTVAHDTSGNGNDANIVGPTWEGTADLNFTQKHQFLSLPTAVNAAKTWQIAVYEPPFGFSQLPLAPGYGDPSSFAANPSLLCGSDATHLCLVSGSPGKASEFQAFNTDGTQSAVPIGAGWHIFSFLCGGYVNGVLTKTHILYDGIEVSSYIAQGDLNTCPVSSSGNFQIGGSAQFYDTWFIGKVAAAWAWSQPLTLQQAQFAASAGLAYIQYKGVTTKYANANNPTPLVITGLDSRTVGYGLSTKAIAWPYVMTLDQPMTRVNVASAGEEVFDACDQFDVVYRQQIPETSTGPVVVALWGSVNDFIYSNQTPAQIADSLKCMVTKAKALGARVVLSTEISALAPSNPQIDQKKNALDLILRANAYSWGVDNLADLATNPRLGADGASSDATCYADTLHLADACEPLVTSVMQNAINELFGATAAAPHTTSAVSYQELAGDDFLNLTGTSTQSIALPSCIGFSLPRSLTNNGNLPASLATLNAEVLSGATQIAPGTTAILKPVPGAPSTGGCSWTRTQ